MADAVLFFLLPLKTVLLLLFLLFKCFVLFCFFNVGSEGMNGTEDMNSTTPIPGSKLAGNTLAFLLLFLSSIEKSSMYYCVP